MNGFWTAVTEASFWSKTSKYPWTRTCLVMANLTSPNVEDGLAKLLTKSDVTRLCSKASNAMVSTMEESVEQAQSIVNLLKHKLDPDAELAPLGRLCVRLALLAAAKETWARHGPSASASSAPSVCT